jgi:hypothetical protein
MKQNPDFRLQGPLAGKFFKALENSYTPERFDQMLFTRASVVRTNYSLANDMPARFYDVLIHANLEGWADKYVTAAIEGNPGSSSLRAFADELGLNPVPDTEAPRLQKVVAEHSVLHDAEPFRTLLGSLISWVCQVTVPGGGGTGLLVGPDLVLTNHHVVSSLLTKEVAPERVSCLFDFKMLNDGRQLSPGRRVALHSEWHVASRPHSPTDTVRNSSGEPTPEELDYALLRLAAKVGEEPVGAAGFADLTAAPRRWLTLSAELPGIETNSPLIVLQHPLLPGRATQAPVQLALGVVLESPFPQLRLRHNARTLSGSSGSPCFNANLELVALHHAGDPVSDWERAEWNQAIPSRRIAADLTARNLTPPSWQP